MLQKQNGFSQAKKQTVKIRAVYYKKNLSVLSVCLKL